MTGPRWPRQSRRQVCNPATCRCKSDPSLSAHPILRRTPSESNVLCQNHQMVYIISMLSRTAPSPLLFLITYFIGNTEKIFSTPPPYTRELGGEADGYDPHPPCVARFARAKRRSSSAPQPQPRHDVVTLYVADTPGMNLGSFGGSPVVINLALHPDPGARAPGPAPWIRIPGGAARQTQGVRTTRAVKCAGRLEFPLAFFDPSGV